MRRRTLDTQTLFQCMNNLTDQNLILGKRKLEDTKWEVMNDVNMEHFLKDVGIVAIDSVLTAIEHAKRQTQDSKIWDNYGYREYIVLLWLKMNYGISDLKRRSGRSGPDCVSEIGGKNNIEVKTTLFKARKRLTALYDLGQFSRQHTHEIRQFTRSFDGIAYAVLFDEKPLPAFVLFLHGDEIIEAHSRLLERKQEEFMAKKPGGQKGGRDTISVKLIDLCFIMFPNDKAERVDGFDGWLHGKKITDWNDFLSKIKNNSGVELR